jgi:hypothetical protein
VKKPWRFGLLRFPGVRIAGRFHASDPGRWIALAAGDAGCAFGVGKEKAVMPGTQAWLTAAKMMGLVGLDIAW